jgi:hypothetical protein
MPSPSHERSRRKEDNFYSVRVSQPPALNRYRDFDKKTFGTHSNFVSTEEYVAKSPDQIKIHYGSDQKQLDPSKLSKPSAGNIDLVHNIKLKQPDFKSISKPTAKRYDPIVNPIPRIQQNPYLQKG